MKKIFSKISLLLIILNIFNTLLGINLKPVYAATENNPPIINIESPTNNLSGVVTIQGYVLSDYDPSTFGFMKSSVYIDGNSRDTLSDLKTSINREDLKNKYSNYKYASTGGFSYRLDTGKLSNGNHKLKFELNEKLVKEIVISVKNNPSIVNIESPINSEILSGVAIIKGYILSDYDPSTFGIFNTSVHIDGESADIYALRDSIIRDDLKNKYPNYKYAEKGGFSYSLDTTKLSNGNHKIKFNLNGIEKETSISVKNNPPIVKVESPINTENLSGIVTIKGYVLSEYDLDEIGVLDRQVSIDDKFEGYIFNLLSRDDIKKQYPNYKYAEKSGFSYDLDTTKLSNGNHKVKFNFKGVEKEISISTKNNNPIVNIESPTNTENLSGIISIKGYILSEYTPNEISSMSRIYVDGEMYKMDNPQNSIKREDLKKQYPNYKYAEFGGFSYDIDTRKLSNGKHKVKLYFRGIEKEITISINNKQESIINIESPTNLQNISGNIKINGYILSDFDPFVGGSLNANVYLDGEQYFGGKLEKSINREDLKNQYPNYKYAGTGGFSYNLDTTKLSNGKHKFKFKFNEIEKDMEIYVKNDKPAIIDIEVPRNMNALTGITTIKGFVLSDYDPFPIGLSFYNMFIDGNKYDVGYELERYIIREDLKSKYPNYKNAGTGGFSYDLDTTKLSNGNHKIKFNFNGIEKEIEITTKNNPPVINIESPISLQNLSGLVTITGYILSEYNPIMFQAMKPDINVYVDGTPQGLLFNLHTSIQREDLKNKYPNYKHAGTGGFSYKLDTTKLSDGKHKIKFSFNGIEKEIEISTKNNPSIIDIESPKNLQNLSGIINIDGYILSEYDPSIFSFMNSHVYVDGEQETNSFFNLKTSIQREDLKKKYPNYVYSGKGGFSYELDTVKLKNGKHKLKFDINGITKEMDISVNNYKQDLVIDKIDSLKAQQGFMKLTGYIVSSYNNVSNYNYNIYIDDVKVNNYTFDFECNLPREDLKDKYPSCRNVAKGGFKYILDTRTLKNGDHKIKIEFKDTESSIDFKVDNSNYNNSLDDSDDVTFEERMKRMSIGLDDGFKEMNESLKQMNLGLNQAIKALDGLNVEIGDFSSINKAIAEMILAINQANEGMIQMNKGINRMNEAINQMNEALNKMNSGIADINDFLSTSIDTLNDMGKALDKTNAEISKLNLFRNSESWKNIDWSGFDLKIGLYNELSNDVEQTIIGKSMNYLAASIEHIIYGKYTNSINTLGVAGDFVIGFIDIDLPADIRDLSHDFKHWQWSWGHAAETTLDAIGVIPIIGIIKYGDEVGVIVKDAEKGLETIKLKGGIKGVSEAVPDIGRKLEYVFGNATGTVHNIERSLDMERQLSRIGIFDNSEGRAYVQKQLEKAFHDTTNGVVQSNGRILKESLLTGPNGVVKMQSIWDGNKLITIEIFGGGK